MKINVAKLNEACDYLIARIEDKEKRRVAAYKEMLAEHEANWWAENEPKWKEYRDELTKFLRTGKVMKERGQGVPRSPHVYTGPHASAHHFNWKGEEFSSRDYSYGLTPVTTLKRTLDLIGQNEVTLQDIKALGFQPKGIQEILALFEEHKLKEEIEIKAKAALANSQKPEQEDPYDH